VNALTDFTEQHPALKFVHVQWLDYVATMRTHVLPITEFRRLVTEGDRIAMSPSNTGLIHPDHADSDTSQMYAEPDLTTLRLAYSKGPLVSATTIASFRNQDASPSPCCPRTSLQNLANLLSSTHNLTFDIAFDLKVVFLKQNDSKDEKPIPWTTNHTSHGSFSPEQDQLAFPLLAEIADELDKIGIRVSNFHAETAAGQYNFVLKSLALVQAIDTLVQARQVVKQIARGYGLRVTLFSTPLASATSIQHANISLASTTLSPDELANKESCFFAAVMAHLPLLCAFSPTTTTATATANIIPPPPRKLKQQTWRLAHLTASSNLYLAFTALLSLGLGGLNEEMQDVTVGLDEEMQDLTVVNDEESTTTTTLTSSTMAQSLQQVERDELIKESMGAELIDAFVAVNKGQLHVLEGLKDDEVRFEWLSERY
jgi:glutamine synthetase